MKNDDDDDDKGLWRWRWRVGERAHRDDMTRAMTRAAAMTSACGDDARRRRWRLWRQMTKMLMTIEDVASDDATNDARRADDDDEMKNDIYKDLRYDVSARTTMMPRARRRRWRW